MYSKESTEAPSFKVISKWKSDRETSSLLLQSWRPTTSNCAENFGRKLQQTRAHEHGLAARNCGLRYGFRDHGRMGRVRSAKSKGLWKNSWFQCQTGIATMFKKFVARRVPHKDRNDTRRQKHNTATGWQEQKREKEKNETILSISPRRCVTIVTAVKFRWQEMSRY